MAKKTKKTSKKTAKKTQPRKPASRKANARRAVRAKTRVKKPKQKFHVSHHNEADFDQGLRTYAKYRDLGWRRRPAAWCRRMSSASSRPTGRRKSRRRIFTTSICR